SSWKDSNSPLAFAVRYISLTSYALYLVNYSLILLTLQYFFNISSFTFLGKMALLVVYLAASFLSAHLLYSYFEKPVMQLRDRPFLKSNLWNW
ncbi:MAG: hypothetical protein R3213_03865, partial [Flavobacteriaceae bacterium]|nr:hypothetical protein [Flavobacteriaceae bacterium]